MRGCGYAPLAKGASRSAQYGHGRTRAVPSLPHVLAQNGLPQTTPLRKGERTMLERNRLKGFYRELQTPSRIEANTRTAQIKESNADLISQLTHS